RTGNLANDTVVSHVYYVAIAAAQGRDDCGEGKIEEIGKGLLQTSKRQQRSSIWEKLEMGLEAQNLKPFPHATAQLALLDGSKDLGGTNTFGRASSL
ncbi:Hypothetical predicted protein, partial [Olea europaea subsp. europaea]